MYTGYQARVILLEELVNHRHTRALHRRKEQLMVIGTQPQFEESVVLDLSAITLRELRNALAERAALAWSLPEDVTNIDSMPFARLDVQVNDQLEAAASDLAAQSSRLLSA